MVLSSESNELPQYSREEREQILRNARTSFTHGLDHLLGKFQDQEDERFKFSILHIFNAVELMVKAYLGSQNKWLLQKNVDDDKLSDYTADISRLLKRLPRFSEIAFDQKLREQIEKLRIHRNEIEHKRFVLNDEEETVVLLCRVIHGLFIFCRDHLSEDLMPELLGRNKQFSEYWSANDSVYRSAIEEARATVGTEGEITECPFCANETVAIKKEEGDYECYWCHAKVQVLSCASCPAFYIVGRRGDPQLCTRCESEMERATS